MEPSHSSQNNSWNSLLNQINQTDFTTHTIEIYNNNLRIIKSKGLLGRSSVNPEKLTNAIKFFAHNIPLNLNESDKKILVMALEKLQNHIQTLSDSTNKKYEYTGAFAHISKLTHQMALARWKESNQSINACVSNLFKGELRAEIEESLQNVEKTEGLTIFDRTLLISKSFLNENNAVTIQSTVDDLIKKNPSVSFIQIQGLESFDIDSFKKNVLVKKITTDALLINNILQIEKEFFERNDDDTSTKMLKELLETIPVIEFIQIKDSAVLIERDILEKLLKKDNFLPRMLVEIVSFSMRIQTTQNNEPQGEPRHIRINPELCAKSDFFYNSLFFHSEPQEESTSTRDVISIPISFETMQLINSGLKFIKITSENVEELLKAAEFFNISELLADNSNLLSECDKNYSNKFVENTKSLEGEELLHFILENYILAKHYNFSSLKKIVEENLLNHNLVSFLNVEEFAKNSNFINICDEFYYNQFLKKMEGLVQEELLSLILEYYELAEKYEFSKLKSCLIGCFQVNDLGSFLFDDRYFSNSSFIKICDDYLCIQLVQKKELSGEEALLSLILEDYELAKKYKFSKLEELLKFYLFSRDLSLFLVDKFYNDPQFIAKFSCIPHFISLCDELYSYLFLKLQRLKEEDEKKYFSCFLDFYDTAQRNDFTHLKKLCGENLPLTTNENSVLHLSIAHAKKIPELLNQCDEFYCCKFLKEASEYTGEELTAFAIFFTVTAINFNLPNLKILSSEFIASTNLVASLKEKATEGMKFYITNSIQAKILIEKLQILHNEKVFIESLELSLPKGLEHVLEEVIKLQPNIRTLKLNRCKVESLSVIEQLKHLEYLEIEFLRTSANKVVLMKPYGNVAAKLKELKDRYMHS